jgi:hypothetical protein
VTIGIDNPCLGCRGGFHNECELAWDDNFTEICCCGGDVKFDANGNVKVVGNDQSETGNKEVDNGYIEDGYESSKSLADYKDPLSTGRKRAAEMYPITAGMVCEWAGLAKAGGGIHPIVGCIGRPASDRHHGPDKNTMNNAPTNLHRICDHCHNTWHALNDPAYGERPDHTQPFIPQGELGKDWWLHDKESKASQVEIIESEARRLAEAR